MAYHCWGKEGTAELESIITSFWENAKGERIGFATNWRREPAEFNITQDDGRMETRRLAPLETIELR